MVTHYFNYWKKLNYTQKTLVFLISIFTCIGLLFTTVFIGMQLNIFTVMGATATRNIAIEKGRTTKEPSSTTNRLVIVCKINTLNTVAPDTAQAISSLIDNKKYAQTVETMLSYASYQFAEDVEFAQQFNACMTDKSSARLETATPRTAYGWANSDEWTTLKTALKRDRSILVQAAHDADISPRLIVAGVIGEQFRFFSGTRTAFKNYFEPLKIFGRLSKFSFGIAGLKPETVRRIEENLVNTKSPFYIGQKYTQFAKYSTEELNNSSDPQLARITDPNNNYYSYLYTGLYMRQVSNQWQKAGYDISNNAGVLATLYNLGFNRSVPKPNPLPGGAIITINNTQYTFGQIADEFYWSGELVEDFHYTPDSP